MVQIAADRPLDTGRSLAKKRLILEAASLEFRRRGLQSTGMREIAARLGMHVGNLYYYFRNKEEILAFCQQDALDGLLAVAQRAAALQGPADDRLRYLIAEHVVCLNEATPGSLAHLEVEALGEATRPPILERRSLYERQVRRLVEAGIHEGTFRDVDARVATRALLGSLNWTVKWFRRDGSKSARQLGAEMADLLVGGLLARSAEPAPSTRAGRDDA